MDDSRLTDTDNCFKLPKDSGFHNYTLRSASKMNPPKKLGVYSKFINRANVTNCSKQNDTVTSRIEQVETQNSRRRNLFNENEPSTSRLDKEETAKTINGSRLAAANNSFKCPKDSTFNNYTLRSASKKNPFRIPGLPSKFFQRADVISENEPRTPPRLDQEEISKILSDEERRTRPQAINETRERILSPPKMSYQNSNFVGQSSIPAKPQHSSNTSFRSMHNSSFRSTMYPRVMLRRCDVDVDRCRREATAQSDGDIEGSVVALSLKRQNELKIYDAEKQNVKRLMSLATDCLLSAEAFYLLNKINSSIVETIQRYKKVEAELQPTSTVAQENMMHVVDWLKSNGEVRRTAITNRLKNPSLVYPGRLSSAFTKYGSEIAASIITNNQRNHPSVNNYNSSENNNRTIYILKDWTLIKGEGIFDVMVSGNLLNINSGNLIEEKHTSSAITSATAVIVQTNCCMYQLQGEFRNSGKCIPFSVSKYFQDGKFPSEWREVIKMWSVLILSEKNRGHSTNAHKSVGKCYENYSADEMSDCNSGDEIREVNYRKSSNKDEGINERYQSNKKDGRRIQGEHNDRWVREPVDNRFKRSLYESIDMAHESKVIRNREIEDRRIRARQNEIRSREDVRIREQNERFQDNGERHRSNVSFIRQKRHFNNMDDDDDEIHVNERPKKRQRVEKSLPKRRPTPATKRVLSVTTRSAVRRNAEMIQTPKSSKANKLPRRRGQTPMPPRMARRLYEQDESSIVDNSDLM